MRAVRVDQAVTRRTVLKGLAGVGIGAAAGAASHGYMYERHHLELTRTSFPIAGLPEALRGLRIGFLTDIHRSQTVSHEAVSAAVQMLMAERPDLIVLGGDYVTWKDAHYIVPAADALAPLAAPLGVIAVLGNHDDDRDMPAALTAKGFTVLRDARTRIMLFRRFHQRGDGLGRRRASYGTRCGGSGRRLEFAEVVDGGLKLDRGDGRLSLGAPPLRCCLQEEQRAGSRESDHSTAFNASCRYACSSRGNATG